jgi:hypothetical protein
MEFTTHLELHSQTTRLVEGASHRHRRRPQTGFSPSLTARSKALRPGQKPEASSPNYNSDPAGGPDFKFELLPLHSPLLGQSRLVSFPPLIDMLKFSGYPYLIRGPLESNAAGNGGCQSGPWSERSPCARGSRPRHRHCLSGLSPTNGAGGTNSPTPKPSLEVKAMTLGQACPLEYRRAQYAFKDSMIHGILQFTLLIAFCCVLHRCRNQEIHC